ncbi:MAG: hypothetical protein HY927_03015 [Elusimicrobia bacterium]|nr:hypothetical protein [Elusimicrobiota bacterium]
MTRASALLAAFLLAGLPAAGAAQGQETPPSPAQAAAQGQGTPAPPARAAVQDPVFELRAATTSARLGVPVTLEAVVRAPVGVEVALDLPASTTDTFAITRVEEVPRGQGGETQRRFRLEILPLDLGKLPVPLAWSFRAGQETRAVKSPALVFDVDEPPSLAADPEIKDIKGIMGARALLWPWLLLAALALAAWAAWRRRRRHVPGAAASAPVADTRPPHVIAEAELAWLDGSGLWESGRYKEFYNRLTDILRQYFDRRFAVPAMKLTTTELIRHMRRVDIDRGASQSIKTVFERADLVKFARWTPGREFGSLETKQAREIVATTTPAPAPKPETAEAAR